MPGNIASALVFIVNALVQLYVLVLLLRFFLPWAGADFRNPIAQAILRLSSPVVVPLRRIVPPIGKVDTATLLVAFAIEYLKILVLAAILGVTAMATIANIAVTALVNLVILALNLFTFAIIIQVIASWIAPGGYNPAFALIHSLTNPVLRPFRRIIPSAGGIDLSPLFAIITLQALRIVVFGLKLLPL
ncbi:MAG: YggT family protein [Gammaproteobacteria bacterium]|nr:YggT family protein [Gammaproteobacteria bacterium]NNF49409.1 YggT family protein [Woeseiaceae bacterium]MBT8093518.1 YggT family protein [Gammaproteobacteria bacterium]MBT8106518.1 YggT family protein [Gammaproteobacteria bacterium]NNK26533.1 YggT family protein [Woeseiaceae bacterium]